MWRSVPQMPTRSTRSSASPGPGFGVGASIVVKRRAPPYEDARMAAILARTGPLPSREHVDGGRDHGLVDDAEDLRHPARDLERRLPVADRIGVAAQRERAVVRLHGEPLAARAR